MAAALAPLLIGPVAALLSDILKRILPEKMSQEERVKLEHELTMELMKADWSLVIGQLEINKVEAGHSSMFVAGWRPAIGWVCGAAFAYNFIVQPFLAFCVGVFKWELPPLPELDMASLLMVLGGMLGLGGMRTFEKVKGVAKG